MASTTPSSSSSSTPEQSQQPPPPPTPPTTTPDTPLSKLTFLPNDPARTGYDPTAPFWKNYYRAITGSLTREGVEHLREDRFKVHEERDCQRCEKYRDFLLAYSPTVTFLREKISDLGGRLDASNVVCRRCPGQVATDGSVARQSGGFSPSHGILLCANAVRNQGHLEDTLAHEMVHAWDHLRWKVDWAGRRDLRHSACTEIRASMLSGECRWVREAFTRGNWTLTQQFQDCVRKRAILSVQARKACKDEGHATRVVNEVWDSCYADKRPFEEVYR